jgi:hypothetical protein
MAFILAEAFATIGILSALANIGLFIVPWLYRWFSNDTFYLGTAEFAVTGMIGLVGNVLALIFYGIAPVPANTMGRRVALVALLAGLSLMVFPPLLGIVGLVYFLRRNPPRSIEFRHGYHFYFTYALSILGFGLIIASYAMADGRSPELSPMDQGGNLFHIQMSGIVCAVATLLFARTLGMARMRGAVLLAVSGLGLWIFGPILFCVLFPLFLCFGRHMGRYFGVPSRTSPQ